jgi:MFS transporter, Spinster family, sphingosine-1-phosphate transporter
MNNMMSSTRKSSRAASTNSDARSKFSIDSEAEEAISNSVNYSSIERTRTAAGINLKKSNQVSAFFEAHKNTITVLILFVMNLINVTDRYVVSSVLSDIEKYFNVKNSTAGLLQTAFLLVYMAFSPINGYLGDRINRKYMLVVSILLWVASTIGGSIVGEDQFMVFLLTRCLFGVATASFETIAVPIIGDTYAGDQLKRSRALIMFNLGPPLGFGLSYLVGITAKELNSDDWRYSLRFTPFVLIVTLVTILVGYKDPRKLTKTKAAGSVSSIDAWDSVGGSSELNSSSRTFKSDVIALCKNKTYLCLLFSWTFGLSSLCGFNWWSSSFLDYTLKNASLSYNAVANFKTIYSITQALCGLFGVLLPTYASNYYKKKGFELIDCFLLSSGFFANSLFLYVYLVTYTASAYFSYFFYMLIVFTYNFGWVVQANVLLDIVEPELRSTANALIIFVLHLLGDSNSPYWIGLIQDACLDGEKEFRNSLYYLSYCTALSLYPLVIVSFMAGTLALFATLTFLRDKKTRQ